MASQKEHEISIALQLSQGNVKDLTINLAIQMAAVDTLNAELAALKAKYEPKEAPVPAMAEGGEK